ncbi:MAG: chemotaxis protein [Desulfamplus sp.]|nr:chemotaxis protein [Desulfamplus sp.]
MNLSCRKLNYLTSILVIVSFIFTMSYTIIPSYSQEKENLSGFNADIKKWAEECRQEITNKFDELISSGKLKSNQLFDTFYIPIPNSYPQKYHTQYDQIFDKNIQTIIDKYLSKDKRVFFVIIVDKNGYVPTHNSIFSKPLTGDKDVDSINNRTKRLFNDRTGLAAARNQEPYLIQKYSRDTGEFLYDFSIPIIFQNQHWGAVRIGYQE